MEEIWDVERGITPVLAIALHQGHDLRQEVLDLMNVDDLARLREEDPYTGEWTKITDNRIVVLRSRFEVDLNRPKQEAIYLDPEQSWGIPVWKSPPPPDVIKRSLDMHDAFYANLRTVLNELVRQSGCLVVYDLHAYNHKRGGPADSPDDPKENPDVNVGTGTLDHKRWGTLLERFMRDLSSFDFQGRKLDVRENVKFRGRYLAQWVHENYPDSACVLAIDVKKFFMDEWTGQADQRQIDLIRQALASTLPGVLACLKA